MILIYFISFAVMCFGFGIAVYELATTGKIDLDNTGHKMPPAGQYLYLAIHVIILITCAKALFW